MLVLLPSVVLFMTQTIGSKKTKPDMERPCFTPDWTPNHSVVLPSSKTAQSKLLHIAFTRVMSFSETPYIDMMYCQAFVMYRIKCFFKVCEMGVQSCILFVDLFKYIPESKNLIDGTSVLSKACLLLPQDVVNAFQCFQCFHSSSSIPSLSMENGVTVPPPPSYFVSGCNLSPSPGLHSEMFPLFVYRSPPCISCCSLVRLLSGAHVSAILRFLSDGILKT